MRVSSRTSVVIYAPITEVLFLPSWQLVQRQMSQMLFDGAGLYHQELLGLEL